MAFTFKFWSNNGTTVTLSPSPDAGMQLIGLSVSDSTSTSGTGPDAGTGWTQRGGGWQVNTADAQSAAVWTKNTLATGSETSIDFTTSTVNANAVLGVGGVDSGTPIDVIMAAFSNNNTGQATPSSITGDITTTANGDLLVACVFPDITANVATDYAGRFSETGGATFTVQGSIQDGFRNIGVATAVQTTLGATTVTGGANHTGANAGLSMLVLSLKSAVAGNTVTPAAGTLALAGLAPTVLDMPRMPAAGTLTLEGQEPQLATPIIAVGWTDANDTWSYVGGRALVGGTQPSFVVGFTPDSGTLTLAGLVPTVTVAAGGGGATVTPSAGTLTLSGLAPSLLTNYIPAPGAGALVLAGLSPSLLVATIVQPGAGALALAGLAPSLLIAQAVSPGAGALVLTGLAPSLLTNFIVQPGAGALVLTGQQPAILNGDSKVAQPDTGTLVLAGLAPTAAATDNRTSAPGSGALVLAGLAPSVLSGFTVTPSAGALVLAGLAPTAAVTDNRTVAPGVGALVLAGAAPASAVSDNRTVAPGTGALVLAGLAPTIPVQSPSVAPDAGTLALEGLAPTVDSGAGNSLLSAKYLGYPNVVVRGLKAGSKAEPEDPLPADITNMPDAPPPPKPRARGLAILGSLTAPEPQPVKSPQVKAPTVKPPPRAAESPAPAAEPAPAPAEPPAAPVLLKPPSRVAQVAKTVESVQAAVQVQNEYLIEQFTALNARIAELQDALAANIAQVEETRARKERNQRRAEEITRKLLMNDD